MEFLFHTTGWFDFIVLATSRHAIPGFVHIDSSTFLSQTITGTLLLRIQTLVILLCFLLDNLSNAYPHASFRPRVWKPHHFYKWRLFTKSLHFTHSCILVANFSHLTSIAPFIFYEFWVLLICPKHRIFFSQERLSQGTTGGQGGLPPCGFPLQGGSRAAPSFFFGKYLIFMQSEA